MTATLWSSSTIPRSNGGPLPDYIPSLPPSQPIATTTAGTANRNTTITTTTTTATNSAATTTVAKAVGSSRSIMDSSKTSRELPAHVCVIIVVNEHLLLHSETYSMK